MAQEPSNRVSVQVGLAKYLEDDGVTCYVVLTVDQTHVLVTVESAERIAANLQKAIDEALGRS